MRDNFAPRRRLKMLIKWFSQPGFEWKTKSHKSHDCGHRLLTTTTNCGRWLDVLVFRRFGGCRRRKSGSNYALPKAFAAAMVYISAQIAIGPGFWGLGPGTGSKRFCISPAVGKNVMPRWGREMGKGRLSDDWQGPE